MNTVGQQHTTTLTLERRHGIPRNSILGEYETSYHLTGLATMVADRRHYDDFTTRLERLATEPSETVRRAMADELKGVALHWVNAAAESGLELALTLRRQEEEGASEVPTQESSA